MRSTAIAGVMFALLLGCGGAPPQDAKAPAKIASLARTSLLTGVDAAEMINNIHQASPATKESWVANYGEEDRLVIYATAFPTPEEAATKFNTMQTRLTKGTSRYSAATTGTSAQQAGFRMQDNETNTQIFNYQKGRWVIGVRGIALDIEPAVFSIEWVAPK